MPSTSGSAALPGGSGNDRVLFGDEAARWLAGRDHDLLPDQARPSAVRLMWLVLAVALLVLAGIGVGIGTVL
ncbi:hypothetical protein [Lentzea flaviverrucosa]|uniref:Uncharacterized protein n=1 Tax=Lentzea flaviverrucosa TaxID=200379 RepID=A0A1H9EP15_9PSEU|nr:hypothetical protein [Lentzea flaviverrucosa]RDI35441.1 hypothetical protein DFR72_1011192 [Lentzea flaviverrucosa]SEQ26963.1 hypothetical protein SAMN05216195_10225 [Lentzea flaviverrucosa]